MRRLTVKGTFNGDLLFFELNDQREDLRRRAAVDRPGLARRERTGRLREEHERDVCIASLRLQLSQLMLFDLPVAKIAPNKFKERRRQELLQDKEEGFAVPLIATGTRIATGAIKTIIKLNGNKVTKVHSFLVQRQR